jgi:D-alanyl-D-alanine carboxypeptidase
MGEADVAQHIPVDADQTFAIAGITNPMLATVVLQLVGEGRLTLDADAHRWLPELRSVRSPMTIEQLLSHRSGLRDVTQEDVDRVGTDPSKLLKAVAKDPLHFDPGTDGAFVGIDDGARGLIVERILSQPLGDVLDDRVFTPAGMTSTTLGGTPDVHDYAAGEDVTATNDPDAFGSATGVVSTAADLSAFFEALWSGDLLSAELVEEMRSSRGTLPPDDHDYGLGLELAEVTCGTAVGHDGELAGLVTGAWTLVDQEQRFVAVMVNDDGGQGARHALVESALCS